MYAVRLVFTVKNPRRRKRPIIRSLIGCLYFHGNQPVSYCLRQWIFDMIRPENLSIMAYDGMKHQGYCALADPDKDYDCWGQVKVIPSLYQFDFHEYETPVTSPKTCSDTPWQST